MQMKMKKSKLAINSLMSHMKRMRAKKEKLENTMIKHMSIKEIILVLTSVVHRSFRKKAHFTSQYKQYD